MKISKNIGLNLPEGTDNFDHDKFLTKNFEKVDQYLMSATNVDAEFNKVNSSLAEKVKKGDLFINVKDYGAKGDGVTDDTTAIITAMAACTNGRYLYFPGGTYVISTKLTVSVPIVGEGMISTIIKNIGTDDGIYLDISYNRYIRNITVRGNPSSKSGIVIASSYAKLDNVSCEDNGEHGIKVGLNTWTIDINNCKAYNNTKSGICAVATGGDTGQINMVNINQCLLHSNREHGAYVVGTRFNIKDCNIEQNKKAGIYISTLTTSLYGLDVKGNYFEANKTGHVVFDLYPTKNNRAYGIDIDNNWLALDTDATQPNLAMIKATTDTANRGITSIKIGKGNTFYTETMLTHVDLGNCIGSLDLERTQAIIETGLSGDTASFSTYYKNLGTALVNHYVRTRMVQGYYFAKGVTYTDNHISDNFVSMSPKTVTFPLQLEPGCVFKKVGIDIVTNSTNYDVEFQFRKSDGTTTTGILYQLKSANSGNKYVTTDDGEILSVISDLRIASSFYFYLVITFINKDASATNFQIKSPKIVYYGL